MLVDIPAPVFVSTTTTKGLPTTLPSVDIVQFQQKWIALVHLKDGECRSELLERMKTFVDTNLYDIGIASHLVASTYFANNMNERKGNLSFSVCPKKNTLRVWLRGQFQKEHFSDDPFWPDSKYKVVLLISKKLSSD